MTGVRGTGTVPGMRHVWSLIAGVVIAPLAWLLASVGQVGAARSFDLGTVTARHLAEPLLFLAAAGLVVGLVASLRVSPVGPLVAGLALVAPDIGLLVDPRRTHDLLNYTVKVPGLATRGDISLPLTTGLSLVVGVLLLVAVAAPGRWRAWPRPVAVPAGSGTGDTGTAGDEATLTEPAVTPTASWPSNTDVPATLEQPEVSTLPTRRPTSPPPEMSGESGANRHSWPDSDLADTTTDTLPNRGRSPWDTPLREGSNGTSDR